MKYNFMKLLSLLLISVASTITVAEDSPKSMGPNSVTQAIERPLNLVKKNDFGLGLKWGAVTGLNLKYWSSEFQAWDVTLASSDNNTILGIDYVVHFREATAGWFNNRFIKNISPYVGVGLLASAGENRSNNILNDHEEGNKVNSALRVPLGVEYLPTDIRLGLFAEIGLSLGIAPKTYTFATADIGGRFYF